MARSVFLVAGLALLCLTSGTGAATVAQTATSVPELSILVEALQAANLVTALDDANLVSTVFAPTNAAFEALLTTLGLTKEQLLASPILSGVLKYHVVPGVAANSTSLTNGQVLPTLLTGSTLTVDLGMPGKVEIKGANSTATVVTPDVAADQSVVHVIDTVLLPASTDGSA
eukprot:jgi/Botrbrau1/6126/Bobra.331_2s0021.1